MSRLTPREREVLDLLATGPTNKTIATTLFITEKTASVHVSNILTKLRVDNRGARPPLSPENWSADRHSRARLVVTTDGRHTGQVTDLRVDDPGCPAGARVSVGSAHASA